MIEIEVSSGQETIFTSCLQLRFLWMVDHWKQEMVSVGGCRSIPRIWSVEAFPSHDDPLHPPSPIYQQLAARIDEAGVAHGSMAGQSGPHDFSTTFAVEERPDEVVIDVEVADHCDARVESLAATYLIEASNGKLHHDGSVTIDWSHPNCRLVLEAEPPATVEAHEAGMGTIRVKASVTPDPADPAHRLRYRWRWIAIPGHQIWNRDV